MDDAAAVRRLGARRRLREYAQRFVERQRALAVQPVTQRFALTNGMT